MSLQERECQTSKEAFDLLQELALNKDHDFVFRGHRDEGWVLGTTYGRHSSKPISDEDTDLDDLTDHFIASILSTGKKLPFDNADRRSKLEYARHYGLPSPLLDWSFSPYIAMFFAFNGTRSIGAGGDKSQSRSVVYALDLVGLADLWARRTSAGSGGHDEHVKEFFEPPIFGETYPGNTLRLLAMPASWNVRMTRQMGIFLYDTLDYGGLGFSNLEQFIRGSEETTGPSSMPTLTKVFVPHCEGEDIFRRLDIAGITGTRLLDDYEGAVSDAINAYNYERKSGYFWDLRQKSK